MLEQAVRGRQVSARSLARWQRMCQGRRFAQATSGLHAQRMKTRCLF